MKEKNWKHLEEHGSVSRGIEIICDGKSFIKWKELESVASILEFLCHGFNVPKGDLRQFTFIYWRYGWEDAGRDIDCIIRFASYFMSPVKKMSQQQHTHTHTQWDDYINRALHLVCITHNFRSLHVLNTRSDSVHLFRCFLFLLLLINTKYMVNDFPALQT